MSRLGDPNSGGVKNKTAAYVTAVAVTILAFLVIFPRLAVRRLEPDESVYHTVQDGLEYYVWFEDNRFVTVSTDEDRCFVNRVEFTVRGKYWKRLFGDLYFKTGSWFSLTKTEKGARPATVVLTCESSVGVFFEDGAEYIEYTEDNGKESAGRFVFYDDRLDADGMLLQKADGLDPSLKELLDKFPDRDPE